MANICYNYIQAFGSERGMAMLYLNLDKYDDEFSVVSISDFAKDPTNLEFSAESKWEPPRGRLQKLSSDYNLVIECEYDEVGSDIAGKFGFDKGELVFNLEFCYLEGKYHLMDWADFIESEVIPRLRESESLNDFIEPFDFLTAKDHEEIVEIYRETI